MGNTDVAYMGGGQREWCTEIEKATYNHGNSRCGARVEGTLHVFNFANRMGIVRPLEQSRGCGHCELTPTRVENSEYLPHLRPRRDKARFGGTGIVPL